MKFYHLFILMLFIVFIPVVSSEILINEFFPDPAGTDNVPMPGGEWVELYNDGSKIDLAGYYLKDATNKKVFITDVTTYGTEVDADDFIVVYMNGKYGFLNNEGVEKIGLYDTENNLIDSVTYENSDQELSWSLAEGRWLQTMPTPNNENYYYNPEENSSIIIEEVYVGSDERVKFGDIVRVKLNIYKGATTKYAVYAWVEDLSKRSQVNLYTKYTNYSLTIPIQIDSNCDEGFENDDYILKVSGLDAEAETEIEVLGLNKKLCQYVEVPVADTVTNKKFEYEIVDFPSELVKGEQFSFKVELVNNYGVDISVNISSYVYKGSKSYSGERELNLEQFVLLPGEKKVVELSNILDNEMEAGQYKLKVRIFKNNEKTAKEITQVVNVEGQLSCPICSCNNKVPVTEMVMSGVELDNVVYESSNTVQKKMAPLLLSFVSLLGVGLGFKEKF